MEGSDDEEDDDGEVAAEPSGFLDSLSDASFAALVVNDFADNVSTSKSYSGLGHCLCI